MKQIASAFVKAQAAFGPALKTSNNPFFKSKYADLSVVIEAVIDALHANGIALIQECHESETGVTVQTLFIHESGEFIGCGKLHVPAGKEDPQGYGSALTYARRYSLMAACGIAPEDDDGNAAKAPQKPATGARAATTEAFDRCDPEEQKFLRELAEDIRGLLGLPDVAAAVEKLEGSNLDSDEKTAIWSLFDSKERAAIKKHQADKQTPKEDT